MIADSSQMILIQTKILPQICSKWRGRPLSQLLETMSAFLRPVQSPHVDSKIVWVDVFAASEPTCIKQNKEVQVEVNDAFQNAIKSSSSGTRVVYVDLSQCASFASKAG
jgi:hypothetical protein